MALRDAPVLVPALKTDPAAPRPGRTHALPGGACLTYRKPGHYSLIAKNQVTRLRNTIVITAPFSELPHAKKAKHRNHNDHQTHDINDTVHAKLSLSVWSLFDRDETRQQGQALLQHSVS